MRPSESLNHNPDCFWPGLVLGYSSSHEWAEQSLVTPPGGNWRGTGREERALTTLGFGEAVMQSEDDLLHEVLDVTLLRATYEDHPVMGEALSGGLLAQLGTVPQL